MSRREMRRNPVGFEPEKKKTGPILWNPMDFYEDFGFEKTKIPREILEDLPPISLKQRPLPVKGEEVGDDRRDLSRSDEKLKMALWSQSAVFKMKTSKEDTFISRRYWNFCEITSILPFSPYGSFDTARRSGDFDGLDFVDVPPLRIIMDVSKGDGSHSSSANGKAQMLSSRSSTPRGEFRVILQLSHWLQDSHLNTFRSTDPKYMPRILGGSGAKALFDNLKNMWLYMIAYRGGGYDRVYGSATYELFRCVQTMSEQSVITEPVLCRFLRDKQEYLHGTYASSVLVPAREKPRDLPTPAYTRAGSTNLYRCYENRLIRTHQLIGETNALREWDRTTRLRDILKNHKSIMDYEMESKAKTFSLRSNFERSLNSNAEFKRLLDKKGSLSDVASLISQGWYDVKFGVVCLSLRQCEWIFHGMKCPSGIFSAEDLTQSEDMFFRDEVSEEESLRVPGVPLRPIGKQDGKILSTKSKMGLYQISEPMLDWSRNLCARIRAERDKLNGPVPLATLKELFTADPEWVNDDTGIIGQAISLARNLTSVYKFILISGDLRLANQVARQANVIVTRINPRDIIRAIPKDNLGPHGSFWSFQEVIQLIPAHRERGKFIDTVLHDWGSIAAASASLSIEQGVLYEKSDIEVGYSLDNGRRFVAYRREKLPKVYLNTYEHVNVIRDRPRRSYANSAWGSDKSFSQRSSGISLKASRTNKKLFLRDRSRSG